MSDEELADLIRLSLKSLWDTVNVLESRGWEVSIDAVPVHVYGIGYRRCTHPDVKITKIQTI